MGYALSTTLTRGFDDTLQRTRAVLADHGFGVLTEIDVHAVLKDKLDVDTPAQVILGACRPSLAHAALQVEPSVGLLLPCNVVVRALDDRRTLVEAMEPSVMVSLTGNDNLAGVAAEAHVRLTGALEALTAEPVEGPARGRAQP